jgi:hypothetical protein
MIALHAHQRLPCARTGFSFGVSPFHRFMDSLAPHHGTGEDRSSLWCSLHNRVKHRGMEAPRGCAGEAIRRSDVRVRLPHSSGFSCCIDTVYPLPKRNAWLAPVFLGGVVVEPSQPPPWGNDPTLCGTCLGFSHKQEDPWRLGPVRGDGADSLGAAQRLPSQAERAPQGVLVPPRCPRWLSDVGRRRTADFYHDQPA